MADLITLAEAEEAVKAGGTAPAAQLAQLPRFIAAASNVIQSPELAGPVLYEERTATFNGGRNVLALPAAPATALTVTVDGTAWAAGTFTPDTAAGLVYGAFPAGTQNVVITYSVGSMDAVPENIKLACMEQVMFLWQTSRQGARRDMTDVTYTATGYAVPNKVRDLCRPQMRALGFA